MSLLALIAAYLIGSLPFAIIVTRAMGLSDPRQHGSGNPGATNVLRGGSKLAAVLTLLGDAGKGWLAVWLAARYAAPLGLDGNTVALVGLAAFLGHLFPIFIGFRGGKGVATALGVIAGFSGVLALMVLGVWLGVALASRYSSLAALVAALVAPPLAYWLIGSWPVVAVLIAMSALLYWRHATNIRRLLDGTEGRFGSGKKKEKAA